MNLSTRDGRVLHCEKHKYHTIIHIVWTMYMYPPGSRKRRGEREGRQVQTGPLGRRHTHTHTDQIATMYLLTHVVSRRRCTERDPPPEGWGSLSLTPPRAHRHVCGVQCNCMQEVRKMEIWGDRFFYGTQYYIINPGFYATSINESVHRAFFCNLFQSLFGAVVSRKTHKRNDHHTATETETLKILRFMYVLG